MKLVAASFLIVSVILMGLAAWAATDTSVTGELVDTKCFLSMGAKGEGHKECAAKCAQDGIPVGVLDDASGKLYVLANASGAFKDHMGHKVTVTGKAYGDVIVPESATMDGSPIPLGSAQ